MLCKHFRKKEFEICLNNKHLMYIEKKMTNQITFF